MEGSAIRFTFTHSEKLKFRKQIETLFQKGEAFSIYPFRVIYTLCEASSKEAPSRIGFSVPKKKMRHAHERNRIKRLLREAWRLKKQVLYPNIPPQRQLQFFIIFTGKEMPNFETCQTAIQKMISIFQQKLSPLHEAFSS